MNCPGSKPQGFPVPLFVNDPDSDFDKQKALEVKNKGFIVFGRGTEIRTPDPQIMSLLA